MLYQKDGNVLNEGQIKSLHPNISFAQSTFAELGWAPYAPPPQEETVEQVRDRLTRAVQNHLDTTARSYNYDNILSACSYAAIANTFQAEGVAFLTWRSAVWAACYQVLADVEAEVRPMPNESTLLAELPAYVAPQ